MNLYEVKSPDAPRALGPYSQAVETEAGRYIFVSGQLGIDVASGELIADTIEEQTRKALENLMAVVGAAGCGEGSIVKTTIYLKRIEDFAAVNEVYADFMKPPYPARACVAVAGLPKGALVEIDAIAVK
ncbi:MAG: Rid family detoxifying hydrolase [Candidatus Eisenbacteria bacterium]